MVFTKADIREELLPKPDCYLPEDRRKSYSFYVSADELKNETVENLYGPFPDKTATHPGRPYYPNSPYNSSREPDRSNFQPLSRNKATVLEMKNVQIENMKKAIAEREQQQRNILKNLSGQPVKNTRVVTEAVVNTKTVSKASSSTTVSNDITERITRNIIAKTSVASDTNSVSPSLTTSNVSTPLSSANSSLSSSNTPIPPVSTASIKPIPTAPILIEDSDDNMDVESDEEDNTAISALFVSNASVPPATQKQPEDVLQNKDNIPAINDPAVLAAANLARQQFEEDLQKEEAELNREEEEALDKLNKVEQELKDTQLVLWGVLAKLSVIQNKRKPLVGEKRMSTKNDVRIDKKQKVSLQTPLPFFQQIPFPNFVPPPPTTARPLTPPPPPPPVKASKPPIYPATYIENQLPKPKPHLIDSDIQPMKDSERVGETLEIVEQLVSFRIFKTTSAHPVLSSRPVPRPIRLVTVDNYTMPLQMILINKNKDSTAWQPPCNKFILPAGVSIQSELCNDWYESPFFIMLHRRATSQPSNDLLEPIIQQVIDTIPNTEDLSSIHVGQPCTVILHETLSVVRKYNRIHPKNEFLAALGVELSFYKNGNTKEFLQDYKQTIAQMPLLSVDVEWQRIKSEGLFAKQLPLILDLLHRISSTRDLSNLKAALSVSSMTTEVLIRLLRLNGLKQVLMLLTKEEKNIESENLVILDMDDTPGLYLQESDKYCIWMIVLYYYVSNTLPEGVCSTWMSGLVKEGVSSKAFSIFMIDWENACLLTKPLVRSTMFGATNILLSMLRHFGKKACSDVKKKPLFVGVLRTLFNFLSNNPSYKNSGTLVLIKSINNIILQVPELQEIITSLGIKVKNPLSSIVTDIYQAKKMFSTSNVYSLSYHVARTLYESLPFNNSLLFLISSILLYPDLNASTEQYQYDIIKDTQQSTADVDNERVAKYVQTIFDRYENTLTKRQTILSRIPFAWMNLLLLASIRKYLNPTLDGNINGLFTSAMANVDSGDGKLVLFKYHQQL